MVIRVDMHRLVDLYRLYIGIADGLPRARANVRAGTHISISYARARPEDGAAEDDARIGEVVAVPLLSDWGTLANNYFFGDFSGHADGERRGLHRIGG